MSHILNYIHVFMKKRIVAILLCAVSFGAYAQQKGDMYIGSMIGLGLSSSSIYSDGEKKNEYNPSMGFSVSPEFHYFVADKFRVGLVSSFGGSKNHFERDIISSSYIFDAKNSYWFIGPDIAKYIRLADNFYYVLELGAFYMHCKSTIDGEYIKRDIVSFNELNLGTGKKVTYRDDFSTGPQRYNAFRLNLRFAQFEFRPVERWGFAMSLLDLTFVRFVYKKKNMYENGEKSRIPKVVENQVNFSVGVNPAVGVHLYF